MQRKKKGGHRIGVDYDYYLAKMSDKFTVINQLFL